jgi:hypothetical protein
MLFIQLPLKTTIWFKVLSGEYMQIQEDSVGSSSKIGKTKCQEKWLDTITNIEFLSAQIGKKHSTLIIYTCFSSIITNMLC